MSYVVRGFKYVVLPLALVLFGALSGGSYLIERFKTRNSDGNWFETERGIDRSLYVPLGGLDQFVRIRSRDRNNPVLLKLHGGPGSVSTPWTHRLLKPIAEFYTVVEWDQRGAGRSKGGASPTTPINYERMIDDTVELIEYLRVELDVEKVVVVGHSWGAMLGLGVIQKRPDLIHAYVGIGQLLAWPEGYDETQRLITAAANDAGDMKTVEMLGSLPNEWPPHGDVDAYKERTEVIQSPLVSYGGGLARVKKQRLIRGRSISRYRYLT